LLAGADHSILVHGGWCFPVMATGYSCRRYG
jgi:hypothetical protein